MMEDYAITDVIMKNSKGEVINTYADQFLVSLVFEGKARAITQAMELIEKTKMEKVIF